MPPSVKVAIDRELWAFAVKEIERINELMDLAEIPKELQGSRLSVAQRVFMYTKMMEGTRAAIDKAAGNTPH